MVTLDKIRADMEKRLQNDKEIHSVEVNANSLDEALADAAVQLDTHVSSLEYEVIQKGFGGLVGLVKKPGQLRVYMNPALVEKKKKTKSEDIFADQDMGEEVKQVDRDGVFYIRH